MDDRIMEIIQLEKRKENKLKNNKQLQTLEQHHIYQYLHL